MHWAEQKNNSLNLSSPNPNQSFFPGPNQSFFSKRRSTQLTMLRWRRGSKRKNPIVELVLPLSDHCPNLKVLPILVAYVSYLCSVCHMCCTLNVIVLLARGTTFIESGCAQVAARHPLPPLLHYTQTTWVGSLIPPVMSSGSSSNSPDSRGNFLLLNTSGISNIDQQFLQLLQDQNIVLACMRKNENNLILSGANLPQLCSHTQAPSSGPGWWPNHFGSPFCHLPRSAEPFNFSKRLNAEVYTLLQ